MNENRLLRTFLAVRLPSEVVDIQRMIKTTVELKKGGLKWVRPGQIHLTLKFLGHTLREAIPDIKSVIDNIVTPEYGFDSELRGTGCFPTPERPRVLWLGIEKNKKRITELVQKLNTALDKIGYPADDQEYIPHVTVGRIKYPPKQTPNISQFLQTEYSPIPFQVARIHFMSSELFPEGPVYSILSTHQLSIEEN
ncbi:MAG: RNA 2',3'-cyclic phosphodiesterase [FCB group bacterium]|nr:RNA 2',3'-cyclic phosphodiesterase [FCB group bacterium]